LELPFAWKASKRFDHGQVCEYRLEFGADSVAILQLAGGSGWVLSIIHGNGRQATARGLFGRPYDALMVLFAEHVPSL
jgi:hypothetical protein